MKLKSIFVLSILSFNCNAADGIAYLKALDEEASDYRKMCIECVTDAKLSKKEITEVGACKKLYVYTTKGFVDLKEKIIAAEEAAKREGETKGLQSIELRNKLVLIMSAKSHMSIAGSILNKVN